MKRNWTALALALGLTLTLTACGGNPGAAETPGSAAPTGSQTPAAESDLDYVKGNGVLKIGYTLFEPMNYLGEDGELTGFETEFATAVCAKLGVEPKFVEINWDAKLLELESKNIDCIWNGMTITPELQEAISISDPYIKNYQVVVIRAADADKYTSTESLAGANLDAEAGSAGEAELTALGYTVTPVKAQSDALMEVAAGTSDAAVIDSLMAAAMVGEGTGYASLTYTCGLNSEEYGVGFRKGSDLAQKLNEFFQSSYADGSMMQIAETYGVQAAIIEQK